MDGSNNPPAANALPLWLANEDAFYRKLGHRLKHRRGIMGFTQHEAAERVGTTFQQIQKYEAGANRIPLYNLCCLAEAYECDLREFLPEVLPPFKTTKEVETKE